MRPSDVARDLVAYDGWANARILATAAQLDPAVPSKGASWGSIEGSLRHLVQANATWLGRFTGQPPLDTDADGPAALAARFAEVQAGLEAFAAGLSDDQYLAAVEFKDSRGNPHSDVLALLLAHLVNHGTYHRGEVALLLTEAGHSPGDLDMIVHRRMLDPTR